MSEMAVIKCMINGWTDEVTDQVEMDYFQSQEGREAVQKIWSLLPIGGVTTKILLDAFKTNIHMQDYIIACNRLEVSKDGIAHYISRLKTEYLKSRARDYISKLSVMINNDESTLDQLYSELTNGVDVDIETEQKPLYNVPIEYASQHFTSYYDRVTNPNTERGIQIKSLPQLNSSLFGMKPGDLVMLAAQSGKGKTALALNLARDFSIDQNYTVYYANAEMNEEDMTGRIASALSLVPATEIYTGIHEGNKADKIFKVSEAYDKIGKSGLIISDIPVMTMKKIRRGFKQIKNSIKKPDIVFIDYIGRMDYEGDTRGLTEWQVLGKLAEQSKILAKQLDVVVIILAQLNEDNSLQGAKKMINPCEMVLQFQELTKEDLEVMTPRQKEYANYKLIKTKVRRNQTGVIYMNFDKKFQRVSEIE